MTHEPDDGYALPLSALVQPVSSEDSALHSFVVTLEIEARRIGDDIPQVTTHRWWIGHLQIPDAKRAQWPIAAGDVRTRAGGALKQRDNVPVRLSGGTPR